MGGRRGLVLASALVGVGLVGVGVLIGRSTAPALRRPDDEPPAASTRFRGELTDTTPLAEEVPPPPAQSEMLEPAVTAPVASAAPPSVKPAAPAPPPPAASAPAAAIAPAPASSLVATPATAPPPFLDPGLVSQGRVFNGESITSSSFDEEDVTEYDPVPDHEVTRSSFDDEDRVD